MASSTPSISIVIPVFNAASRLPALFEALQQLDPLPQQLVFVDDGSSDSSLDCLRRFQELGLKGRPVVVATQKNSGPARARNLGISLADSEWVAFTDDDCLPAPGWLGGYVDEIQKCPGLKAAFGRVEATGEIGFLSHYVENHGDGHQTANALYHRPTMVESGCFDQSFPTPYLEDTELYMRIKCLGPVTFVKQALVHHPTRPTTLWNKIKRVRMYRNDFLVYRKHPEAYRQRHRGFKPGAYLLYFVFLKHALAILWKNRALVWQKPREFAVIVSALVGERVLLSYFLLRWVWVERLEDLSSSHPASQHTGS